MRNMGGRGRVLSLFVVVLVLIAGCAARQSVRSDAGSQPAASAGTPGGTAAEGANTAQEAISAETVPPETGALARAESAPPPASAAETRTAAAGIAATEEVKSSLPDIHFDFNKFYIRDEDKPILAGIAEKARKSPGMKILIEGHCDERGTSEYNLALGARRAESTREYLASLGVPKAVLSTVSFGKEKPADPGHNESAWAKNRRAHFVTP